MIHKTPQNLPVTTDCGDIPVTHQQNPYLAGESDNLGEET